MSESTASANPSYGLEKLSNELRIERQKCTNALQERAKLKVEVEKLRQENVYLQNALNESLEEIKKYQGECVGADSKIHELQDDLNARDTELKALQNSVVAIRSELKQEREAVTNNSASSKTSKNIEQSLKSRIAEIEMTLSVRDNQIIDLKEEIDSMKRKNEITEDKYEELNSSMISKQREFDEIRSKAMKTESLTRNFSDMQRTGEQMKTELEQSIRKISEVSQRLRDANERISTYEEKEESFTHQIDTLNIRLDGLTRELEASLEIQNELQRRNEAENESTAIAKMQYENALKTKVFLEKQVEEYKISYEKILQQNSGNEDEILNLNQQVFSLRNELEMSRELIHQRDTLIQESQGKAQLIAEVENLRHQLNEMRKKMIKKEVDDELDKLTPGSVLEREKGIRKMYEEMIEDLRHQLDKTNSQLLDMTNKQNDALMHLSRLNELEQNVLLYKEAAKIAAVENHSASFTASEAIERQNKTSHEISLLYSDLKSVEQELHLSRSETNRLGEELTTEKCKYKVLYLEKLTSDRRLAELIASVARAEAHSQTCTNRVEGLELDCSRNARKVEELTGKVDTYKKRYEEVEAARLQLLSKVSQFNIADHENANKVNYNMELEISNLKQTLEIVTKENKNYEKTVKNSKVLIKEQNTEIERLKSDLTRMRNDFELNRRDISSNEFNTTELQLTELKKDFTQMLIEHEQEEYNNNNKNAIIKDLKEQLALEKEKCGLLKTQMKLLEERIQVMSRELSVFRSLDIYHTTMDQELKAMRDNSPETHKMSMKNAIKDSNDNNNNSSYSSYSNNTYNRSDTNAKYRQKSSSAQNRKESNLDSMPSLLEDQTYASSDSSHEDVSKNIPNSSRRNHEDYKMAFGKHENMKAPISTTKGDGSDDEERYGKEIFDKRHYAQNHEYTSESHYSTDNRLSSSLPPSKNPITPGYRSISESSVHRKQANESSIFPYGSGDEEPWYESGYEHGYDGEDSTDGGERQKRDLRRASRLNSTTESNRQNTFKNNNNNNNNPRVANSYHSGEASERVNDSGYGNSVSKGPSLNIHDIDNPNNNGVQTHQSNSSSTIKNTRFANQKILPYKDIVNNKTSRYTNEGRNGSEIDARRDSSKNHLNLEKDDGVGEWRERMSSLNTIPKVTQVNSPRAMYSPQNIINTYNRDSYSAGSYVRYVDMNNRMDKAHTASATLSGARPSIPSSATSIASVQPIPSPSTSSMRSKDINFRPSKSDFERAKQLLAKSQNK